LREALLDVQTSLSRMQLLRALHWIGSGLLHVPVEEAALRPEIWAPRVAEFVMAGTLHVDVGTWVDRFKRELRPIRAHVDEIDGTVRRALERACKPGDRALAELDPENR
jgi:hypothetical protein